MAEDGSGDWCLIESDPGVFTELLEKLGCRNVQLHELWSIDEESLASLPPVYGFIFLFQWKNGSAQEEETATSLTDRTPLSEEQIPVDLFFAHQVTTNACATQAILSVLLNSSSIPDADKSNVLGTNLLEFASFTSQFPSSLKGLAISSSDEIRTSHNSFARQDAFLAEGKVHIPTGEEEAFHFVAYVPHQGTVYELDGLKKGPIVIGSYDEDNDDNNNDWMSLARNALQERMAGNNVKFNLMAVVQDARVGLKEQLAQLQESDEAYGNVMGQLASHEAQREQWKLENERRRHNYVPLCMQLLIELAKQGQLPQLIQQAQERTVERRAKKATSKG